MKFGAATVCGMLPPGIAVVGEAAVNSLEDEDDAVKKVKQERRSHSKRKRRYINSIFAELGPDMIRRAYRMHSDSFWKLLAILDPHLDSYKKQRPKKGRGCKGGAKNGSISNGIRLSAAIRYFAGGRPEDIALVHGIAFCEVFTSVWRVVESINACDAGELAIVFPEDHKAQHDIAKGFQELSKAGFDNCVGTIDGLLVWLEAPTLDSCEAAQVGRKKFFCGRKGKFGLGLQGLCDSHGRFTNVFIGHPATTSDFLAFSTSPLYHSLKDEKANFLAKGLCIYGDSAYVATEYMATPFKNVGSGPKFDYNFFHSQVSLFLHASWNNTITRQKNAHAHTGVFLFLSFVSR